jgi:ribosomal-protein-alanine N-acetyltransferase
LDFEIRSFRYGDLDQVRALEEASFPDPYSKLWFRLLKVKVRDRFIVAQKEGIMGYAISEVRGTRGHIISMAVTPEYRRAGIGEALLQETIKRLGSKIEEIYLEVSAGNEAAIRLYEKFSFKRTGERRTRYYPGGEDALIMAKTTQFELHSKVVLHDGVSQRGAQ